MYSGIDKTKILMTKGSLMKVESNADGAFCNTFDRHYVILSLETHFLFFLRMAVLQRFYCRDTNEGPSQNLGL